MTYDSTINDVKRFEYKPIWMGIGLKYDDYDMIWLKMWFYKSKK